MLKLAKRSAQFVAFIMAVVLATPAANAQSANSTQAVSILSEAERIHGLALLWREVSYNFPFFDQVPELDWDETFTEFLNPAREAESTLEYYRVLQRFVGLLEDGHTNVYFPDSLLARRPFDDPWVRLEAVRRRPIVANVDAALADRLPLGSEIVSVDSIPAERYLSENVLPYMAASTDAIRRERAIRGIRAWGIGLLVGPANSSVQVGFLTPSGEEREIELTRDRYTRAADWVKAPTGPRPLLEFRWLEKGMAYVALNSFSKSEIVQRFEAVKQDLMTADGIVLDLRRNGGGSDFNATAILSHFTDEALVGSGSRIRVNDALYRAYGSYGETTLRGAFPSDSGGLVDRSLEHHRGVAWRIIPPDTIQPDSGPKITAPVVVLIGPRVASSAENFLVFMPDTPQFTTVGLPTVGSTGQPARMDLPGGGWARVVSRAAILPDGSTWVGEGIIPDVSVEPTVADVVGGRDVVLERGIQVLREDIHEHDQRSRAP
ncbi:MAG: S41 family peptidase [Gemmatimonadota bacterium]